MGNMDKSEYLPIMLCKKTKSELSQYKSKNEDGIISSFPDSKKYVSWDKTISFLLKENRQLKRGINSAINSCKQRLTPEAKKVFDGIDKRCGEGKK